MKLTRDSECLFNSSYVSTPYYDFLLLVANDKSVNQSSWGQCLDAVVRSDKGNAIGFHLGNMIDPTTFPFYFALHFRTQHHAERTLALLNVKGTVFMELDVCSRLG